MRYPTLIARIFIIPIERRDDTRIGNQESLVEYIRIRIKVLSAISERKMITKLFQTMKNRPEGWQILTIGCLLQFLGIVSEHN